MGTFHFEDDLDDLLDDEDEEDDTDPFGEDEDPYGEEDDGDPFGGEDEGAEDPEALEDAEEEAGDSKDVDQTSEKDAEKSRKKAEKDAAKNKNSAKDGAQLGGINQKKLMKIAKSLGYPTMVQMWHCPRCKKQSVFPDKWSMQMFRAITSKYIGWPGNDHIIRYVCLNPKCRNYYPKSGVKYSVENGIDVDSHRNIFHIVK